ncbi:MULTISPECIES: exopolysaccharide biosynthesis polyprenyl glycosylphosphotransferase [Rhodococcus]|uniref:exopolysaccharide biosynthesis polyprenyl glycosylphosphotransferase n=1 Tax=Rhodococcus TaxID=1827 RepID=UPI00101F3F71|nr:MULTISPECIES: exopolysaccharide biosynthesis polyprenyl glycosylphosphotransferase [Rhodococcus]UTT49583.1 exopolysaccharide biosynthesis polyprenyl glycosylphosphotransferase [Rhodococcus gordoniae]
MTTNTRRARQVAPLRPSPVFDEATLSISQSPTPTPHPRRHLGSRIRAHITLSTPISDLAVLSGTLALTGADRPLPTATTLVLLMAMMGAYRSHLTLSVLDDLPRILAAVTLAGVITALMFQPYGSSFGAVRLTALAFTASTVSRIGAYAMERHVRRNSRRRRRTVIVGGGDIAGMLAEEIVGEPACGLELVGLLDDDPRPDTVRRVDVPVLPLSGRLREFLSANRIETAILAFSFTRDCDMLKIVRKCDRLDCEIYLVPRLWEITAVSGDMERIGAMPLMRVRRAAHRSLRWKIKLWTSRVFSAVILVALTPLLVLTAVAVWFSDRSAPILFRQRRVGLDGREFDLLKFRTLKPLDENESATNWCIAQDARLGRLGKILRATSFDELPQLWNIVRGDMTLVGPRPERPHFVHRFGETIPNYSARHRVPSGLTGWAAVNGLRGDTSIAARARYDNFYIENWGLWFDIKILLRTVSAVITMKGR